MAAPGRVLPVAGVFFAILAVINGNRKDMDEDEIKVAEFDVKPGAGLQFYEDKWDDVTCTFTYIAQGGTKEQWAVGMSRNKDQSKYVCSVERPGGKSYLFFEEFKLEIDGPGLKLEETELEKEPGVRLENKEYVVLKKKNQVFQWDGKFGSQLSKVEVYATRGKQEL